jgi:hypothetical protein
MASVLYTPWLIHFTMFFLSLSFDRCVDPKINIIPVRIINFVTRTVIGTIWGQFLHVAKQVQNKERMKHMNAIQAQPELYQFIELRVQQLLLNSVAEIKQ